MKLLLFDGTLGFVICIKFNTFTGQFVGPFSLGEWSQIADQEGLVVIRVLGIDWGVSQWNIKRLIPPE